MKKLAAFLLVLILVSAPSCKWLRKKGIIGRKARNEAILRARQDSIRVADSLRTVQARLLAMENARQDSIRNAEQQRNDLESKNRYNIIVGSFITPEYARSYLSEFVNRGYPARLIKLEGTSFEMVSAESHESFSRAVARLKQFQDTVAYDSWLYIFTGNQ